MERVKVIGGKRYGLAMTPKTKKTASYTARVYRQRGYSTRIVKDKNCLGETVYCIYIRKDK